MFSKYNESNIDIFELYTISKYIKEQIATLPVRIIGIAREKKNEVIMTDLEKAETERIACDLTEAVHSMNNLNKEQIEYLDIIFKKLFIDKEFEKIQKKYCFNTQN